MLRFKRCLLPFLLFILTVFGSANAQKDLSDIKQHVQELIVENYVQGLSAAYIHPDGEVQYFSFGDSAIKSFEFNKNTIYEIGSVSKTFTSLILARMIQESKVSLGTSIQATLPDTLNLVPYDSTKITLLHLATHTSGLPRLPSNFKPEKALNPYAGYTVQQMYEFLDNYEPAQKPGTELSYSNLGIGLLGHLLVLESGMSYEHLLRHYITEPLKMDDTHIDVPPRKKDRFAEPYAAGTKVGRWRLPPAFVAAGGIRSTASDLVTYLKAQMGLTETNFDEAIAMTHKTQFDINNKGILDKIGLTWFHSTKYDTLIFHGGKTGGYVTFAGWNKEDQTGAVVLASGTQIGQVTNIGLRLLDKRFEMSDIQETVSIDSARLAAYTGTYKMTTAYFYVTRTNDQLWVQIGGQPKAKVYPESETRFFYKGINAEIEFHQGSTGTVTGLTLYQFGREVKAEKISDKISKSDRKTIEIDPDSLYRYEGVYQISPLFNVTVFQEGDHLMAQATRQQAIQIYSESKTRFFYKAVPAEIEFIKNEDGEIVKLKLYQGGRELTGVKNSTDAQVDE